MEEGKLYYTISDVSQMLGVNASVLRFWESEFTELRPTKNNRGARMYKKQDIDLLKQIYHLTRECGFTLDGAKEQLRSGKNVSDEKMQIIESLNEVKQFLINLKEEL